MWPFKKRANRDSVPQSGPKPMVHGAPKSVGPQIPIDPDNPKPPGLNQGVEIGQAARRRRAGGARG